MLGITLILCLNLFLVHHFTGVWQLAAKTSTALIDTLSYHLNIPDMNKIPGMQSMGYLEFMRSYPRLLVSNPLKNLSEMFSTIMPAFLWFLALVGFVAGVLQKERFFNQMFLLCSFAPLVVIVVFYYITGGYVEPFLPVVFLWCAEGGCTIERFLSARIGLKRFSAYNPAVMAASLVYAGALLIPQIPEQRDLSTYTWQEDDSRRDQKNIGLMLKRYLPPGKVMTQATRIAYYSEHEMVGIPNTDLQGIEKAATENEARFLVLHGRMFGTRPPLDHLFSPLHTVSNGHYFSFTPTSVNDGPGLHKYLVYSNPNSLGVIVYEIIR